MAYPSIVVRSLLFAIAMPFVSAMLELKGNKRKIKLSFFGFNAPFLVGECSRYTQQSRSECERERKGIERFYPFYIL